MSTEACKLQPSVIEVGRKNTVPMVRKVARKNSGAPLQGYVEYTYMCNHCQLSTNSPTIISGGLVCYLY